MATQDYRVRYPLPSEVVPSGWGVNIHFEEPGPGEVEKLATTFRWARMDFFWQQVEHRKGAYDFVPYDHLVDALERNHVRPYFIFDYGNDQYQDGAPRSPEARQAFCNFVAASVRHFRHRGIVWEMWNEPNIGFWKPKPDVHEYAALALDVGRTIRSVAPDEWYIGPATSGFDWSFLQGCIDAGLLAYWDAVSVHPYRGGPPESVGADWDRLRGMIAAAQPRGRHIRMISGEWGYSDVNVSPDQQRDFIARQYLTNLMDGVPFSIWYDWKNDGPSPTDAEHHFGANNQDMSSKATFGEASAISSGLAGFRYSGRLDVGDPNDYVLQFRRGSDEKLAVWTTAAGHTASLPGTGRLIELNSTPRVTGR